MKKILVSLTVVSICLTACGKEGDFKKAINEKLSKKPVCLNVHSDTNRIFLSDDFKKIKDRDATAYIIDQSYDHDGKEANYSLDTNKQYLAQLDSLTAVGLLTKSTESSVDSYNGKPTGTSHKYTIYTLTAAGKATAAKVETSSMSKAMFGGNGSQMFCYATPEVDKIENYVEGDGIGGVHYADVKYSYTYTNIAEWANKPDVKAAFPEIAKTLDDPQKTAKMEVAKTNNGWSTDL